MVVSTLVLGVFFLYVFVLLQVRSKKPLLDFSVFKFDMFTLSSVINAIITIAMFAGMFLIPIYLQNLRGFTAFESGLLLLPGAIIMGLMSPISGVLFDKVGPRPLAVMGLLITTVTTYEFTHLTLETSYTWILIIYMIRSFGMSLLMMPIMTARFEPIAGRDERSRHGDGQHITANRRITWNQCVYDDLFHPHPISFRETGGSSQYDGSGLQRSFLFGTERFCPSCRLAGGTAQSLMTSTLYGQAAQHASVLGINDAFVWATVFAFIGLILSFFLRDVRKDKKVSG